MADETSGVGSTSQAPGQAPEAATTRSEATARQSSEAVQKTETAQESRPAKVDLFQSEEFRKWESNRKKQEMAREQQYQQQMARMQQDMQNFRLQSAPEEERVVIERDMLRQQMAQLQQEQQRQAMLSQQYSDIQRLAEYSGMKADDLWQQNFSNIGDAAFYAMEHMTKRQKAEFEKAVDAEIERRAKQREANASDLGGGAPVTTDSLKEKGYKDALKRKDGKAFVLQYLQGE